MTTWPARYPLPQTVTPVYFVQSPPNIDVDKMSTGSDFSPFGSPVNRQGQVCHYHHESVAEPSSTLRSSGPLRNGYSSLQVHDDPRNDENNDDGAEEYDEIDGLDGSRGRKTRFYSCLLFTFVLAFTIFCLILWGVSKSFSPIVTLKGMVIESLNVQSGNDASGLGSAHRYANSKFNGHDLIQKPCNFFHCPRHLSSLQVSYSQLILASGQMEKFSQRRKTERIIETKVVGNQISLYGGVPPIYGQRAKPDRVVLPLNLTFTLRSRAYVLGRLVKTKFYTSIRCNITFHGVGINFARNLSSLSLALIIYRTEQQKQFFLFIRKD